MVLLLRSKRLTIELILLALKRVERLERLLRAA